MVQFNTNSTSPNALYQWQYSTDNVVFVNFDDGGHNPQVSGANAAVLQLDNIPFSLNANFIRVVLSSSDFACVNETSNSVQLTVIESVDLQMSMTVSNATPLLDSTVNFALIVKNGNPSAASNVVVNALLPAGFTLSAASR